MWRRDLAVITIAQLHQSLSSNPTRSVSGIRDGQDV